MKQVHNCRLRVQAKDKAALKDLFASIVASANIKEEDAQITIQEAEGNYESEYAAELWLDNQQPVRKLLNLIKEKISKEEQELIAKHPEKYLDVQTHCFLHFDAEKLAKGEWKLNRSPDAAILRLNIAAFPATKANAEKIVRELFSDR